MTYTNGDYISSWMRRLNIIKVLILPKLSYRFNAIPVKITVGFFVGNDELILEKTHKSPNNLIKEEEGC